MTKDETKDTTKTQGTNEHKNYFLSYASRNISLLYQVNENDTLRVFSPFFTETTNSKNENKEKNQYRKQTPDHETNFGRNVVILVGSVLSFILILAIIREICLCCRFSRPTGPRTPFGDVYTDIAEIENRRTE